MRVSNPRLAAVTQARASGDVATALLAVDRFSGSPHPRARRILDVIRQNPGATFSEILAATGLPNGVMTHHLDQLIKDGHAVARVHRKKRHYFENGGPYTGSWFGLVVLRNALHKRLLDWLTSHPDVTQAQVIREAESWGWRRGVTQKRLNRLVEAGLLKDERKGRSIHYISTASACSIRGHQAT